MPPLPEKLTTYTTVFSANQGAQLQNGKSSQVRNKSWPSFYDCWSYA
jgi:hypothetical protein